ncbi:outer membrane beta-barrel protein [Marinobacteraceae bacterium S3BR75-40.1]
MRRTLCRAGLALLLIFATSVLHAAPQEQAAQGTAPDKVEGKEGLDYIGLTLTRLDHRSLGDGNLSSQTLASQLILGTYLTDLFTVEGRLGGGWNEDNPYPWLDVGIKYFASWYIGINYSWTPWSSVYAKYGFSSVHGNADKRDPRDYGLDKAAANAANNDIEEIDGDFLSSSFSVSWLAGVDMAVTDNTYAIFEVGRLHADTTTDIKTFQYSLGVRYDF